MPLRVLITGTNRGIGLEFVRQYLLQGAQIFAAARQPYSTELSKLAAQHPSQLLLIPLNVTDDQELQKAVQLVGQNTPGLDLLINNAAISSSQKSLGSFERAEMLEVLNTNAVAPILVGQAFLPLLRQGSAPKIVNISTQIGSFTWNTSGMSPLYAASKSALNMYTRSFANQAAEITTIALHPGWVQTDMGGADATLTAPDSVSQIRRLVEKLTPADNGQFFSYNGLPHPW